MIARIIRIASHIVMMLIIVQAVTGVLLSVHYVPDSGAAEVRYGVPGTIRYDSDALVVGGDTLASSMEYALVPASRGDVVPSGAAASVHLTIDHHVTGGAIIRYVHNVNASALVMAVLILFGLLVVNQAWTYDRWLWWTTVLGVVVILVAAFTGRLLPDDVYSYVSAQIVRHELSEFPFGSAITALLGLSAPAAARLSTIFVIHAMVLPALITVGVCLLWRKFGTPSTLSILGAIAAVAIGMLISTPHYPIRDISNNVHASGEVAPWWPFAFPNLMVTWLGAELTGYLVLAAFLGLITVPLWARRSPR